MSIWSRNGKDSNKRKRLHTMNYGEKEFIESVVSQLAGRDPNDLSTMEIVDTAFDLLEEMGRQAVSRYPYNRG